MVHCIFNVRYGNVRFEAQVKISLLFAQREQSVPVFTRVLWEKKARCCDHASILRVEMERILLTHRKGTAGQDRRCHTLGEARGATLSDRDSDGMRVLTLNRASSLYSVGPGTLSRRNQEAPFGVLVSLPIMIGRIPRYHRPIPHCKLQ